MARLIFSWDYTSWPIFSDPDGPDPYPDLRQVVSPELRRDLEQWAHDMGTAYADETGQIRPSQQVAADLDARYDELTARLIAEGFTVEPGPRWWRESR